MTCCPAMCNSGSEIAFSQVREDPLTEWRVLNQLASHKSELRVLLIASGGCTALSLLAHPAVNTVAAIDINPAQLHLVELRRQALQHLSLPEQRRLLGIDPAPEAELLALYDRLRPYLPVATGTFWDERAEQISFGLNRVGRFEQLFRELALRFTAIGLDPLQNPDQAISHPQWQSIFEQVFERDKLAQTFGAAAVDYSMERSFGEHFADVFAQALRRYHPEDNYFLTQVWRDTYPDRPEAVPLYLMPTIQRAILQAGADRLHLHQGSFETLLPQLTADAKFDLIQFSNISDWMPPNQLHAILATMVNSLYPGGALLGRRLNGDHHLATMMADHLRVDEALSQELLAADRSYFYREIVVGFCG